MGDSEGFDLMAKLMTKKTTTQNVPQNKTNKLSYTPKELIRIRNLPLSKKVPSTLKQQFFNGENLWDPDLWSTSAFPKISPMTSKKKNKLVDDVLLQPQGRSFHGGCFVDKSKSDKLLEGSNKQYPRFSRYPDTDRSFKKSYDNMDFDDSRFPSKPRQSKFALSKYHQNYHPSTSKYSSCKVPDVYEEEIPEWMNEEPNSCLDSNDGADDWIGRTMPTDDLDEKTLSKFRRKDFDKNNNNDEDEEFQDPAIQMSVLQTKTNDISSKIKTNNQQQTAQISKVMSPLEKLEFNFDDQKEVRLNHKPPSLAFNKPKSAVEIADDLSEAGTSSRFARFFESSSIEQSKESSKPPPGVKGLSNFEEHQAYITSAPAAADELLSSKHDFTPATTDLFAASTSTVSSLSPYDALIFQSEHLQRLRRKEEEERRQMIERESIVEGLALKNLLQKSELEKEKNLFQQRLRQTDTTNSINNNNQLSLMSSIFNNDIHQSHKNLSSFNDVHAQRAITASLQEKLKQTDNAQFDQQTSSLNRLNERTRTLSFASNVSNSTIGDRSQVTNDTALVLARLMHRIGITESDFKNMDLQKREDLFKEIQQNLNRDSEMTRNLNIFTNPRQSLQPPHQNSLQSAFFQSTTQQQISTFNEATNKLYYQQHFNPNIVSTQRHLLNQSPLGILPSSTTPNIQLFNALTQRFQPRNQLLSQPTVVTPPVMMHRDPFYQHHQQQQLVLARLQNNQSANTNLQHSPFQPSIPNLNATRHTSAGVSFQNPLACWFPRGAINNAPVTSSLDAINQIHRVPTDNNLLN